MPSPTASDLGADLCLPLQVSTFLSAFVLAANVAYVLWVRNVDPLYRPGTGRQAAILRGDVTFSLRRELGNSWTSVGASLETVQDLPAFFWILAITQILQNGVVQTYISLEADLLKETRGSVSRRTSLSTVPWLTRARNPHRASRKPDGSLLLAKCPSSF